MAAATIRLGKISSINYTAGKARVVYEDRDDSVTSELPFLALQYNIPKVDDLVVVACFSNGTVSGVILGPVYNSANTPHEGGAGIFRQEMSNNVNEAVMSYSEKKQTIILRAPKIEFEGYGYEDKPYVTLEQINDAFSDIDDNKTGISNLQDDTARTKGKPSLQAQLACNVFHMDDFFLRPEQRTPERLRQPGGNVDFERFLTEVLRPLRDGAPVTYRPYDCRTQQLCAPVHAEARPVNLIEGSYSCHPALWDLYDLHVFLSVSPEEQRRRIAVRNGEKMLPMFTNVWIPMEEAYFAQFRVAERADLCTEN